MLAREYSLMLLDTFNRLRRDAIERMGHAAESLPEASTLPRLGLGRAVARLFSTLPICHAIYQPGISPPPTSACFALIARIRRD